MRYYLQFPAAIPLLRVNFHALLSLAPLSAQLIIPKKSKKSFSLDLHA